MKTCFWCSKKLETHQVTRDHMVARPLRRLLRRGYSNVIKVSCKKCNQDRGKISGLYYQLDQIQTRYRARVLQIEKTAYRFWEEAGRPWGRELEFWGRAEKEFKIVRRLLRQRRNCLKYRDKITDLIDLYKERVQRIENQRVREICLLELETVSSLKD